jgi:hypothetical protein
MHDESTPDAVRRGIAASTLDCEHFTPTERAAGMAVLVQAMGDESADTDHRVYAALDVFHAGRLHSDANHGEIMTALGAIRAAVER